MRTVLFCAVTLTGVPIILGTRWFYRAFKRAYDARLAEVEAARVAAQPQPQALDVYFHQTNDHVRILWDGVHAPRNYPQPAPRGEQ